MNITDTANESFDSQLIHDSSGSGSSITMIDAVVTPTTQEDIRVSSSVVVASIPHHVSPSGSVISDKDNNEYEHDEENQHNNISSSSSESRNVSPPVTSRVQSMTTLDLSTSSFTTLAASISGNHAVMMDGNLYHHSLYSVTRKRAWNINEDNILIALVEKFGNLTPWSEIASHLPGRSGKQCRERWHNHLDTGIKKDHWTQEEDKILVAMHQIYGNKWAQITQHLPGRRDNAVKNRFHALQRLFTRNDPQNLPVAEAHYPVYFLNKRKLSDVDEGNNNNNDFNNISLALLSARSQFLLQHQQASNSLIIAQSPSTYNQILAVTEGSTALKNNTNNNSGSISSSAGPARVLTHLDYLAAVSSYHS